MATISTRLTERLELSHPIVQAPIGSATCPALAAAVADAGGLGMLAVTWRQPAEIRELVDRTRGQTDGAVGANVVVDPKASDIAPAAQVEACLDAGAEVLSFSFGDATPYVDSVHESGGVVMQTVGTAEAAREAVDAGVDIVVAQGWEAGGHVQSDVATMALVPRVVDAVPETPVIAAGGIGDGRGIAAALALGADGGWLGTRFLAAEEANTHDVYAERVTEADESETVYGTIFDEGWPGVEHRVLENETTAAYENAGRPAEQKPGADDTVAREPDGTAVSRYEDSLAVPGMEGAPEKLPLYAGQSAGIVDKRKPAAAVVKELAEETAEALDQAGG